MIHIFHGEHSEASRNELTALRKKFSEKEIIVLDGKRVTLTELKQATEAHSLFGVDRLVIVEQLLSRRMAKKSSEEELLSQWIQNLPQNVEIAFWEEKELGKTILSLFPKKTDIAVFKPDKSVFAFVEALRPKNTSDSLKKLEQAISQDGAELVFAMLVRQIRLLIMIKDLGKDGVGLSPWQAGKLERQVAHFTLPQLLRAYEHLLILDATIKSGKSAFALKQELELFLVSL